MDKIKEILDNIFAELKRSDVLIKFHGQYIDLEKHNKNSIEVNEDGIFYNLYDSEGYEDCICITTDTLEILTETLRKFFDSLEIYQKVDMFFIRGLILRLREQELL